MDDRHWHLGLPPGSALEVRQARIEEMYAREATVADRARFLELEDRTDVQHCKHDGQ